MTFLVQPPRRAIIPIPVHGLSGRVGGHGAHFGGVIERFDACHAADTAVLEATPRRELEGRKSDLTLYKCLYMLSTWLGRECGLSGRATPWKNSPRFLPKPNSS